LAKTYLNSIFSVFRKKSKKGKNKNIAQKSHKMPITIQDITAEKDWAVSYAVKRFSEKTVKRMF